MSGAERSIALSAYRKLTDIAEAMTCNYCEAAPSRRRNGLCDACDSYGRKYGHLPPERVLVKRGSNP